MIRSILASERESQNKKYRKSQILYPLPKISYFSNSSAFASDNAIFSAALIQKPEPYLTAFFIYITINFNSPDFYLGKICLPFVSFFLLSLNSLLLHCTLIQTPASFINKSPCLSIPSWNIYVGLPDLCGCVTSKLLNIMHFSSLSRHSRLFLLWLQPIFQSFPPLIFDIK